VGTPAVPSEELISSVSDNSAVTNSVRYFGYYVGTVGVVMSILPETLPWAMHKLSIAFPDITPDNQIWVRVLGALLIILAIYYVDQGNKAIVLFIKASVQGRILFFSLLLSMALAGRLPWVMLLPDTICIMTPLLTWYLLNKHQ